MVTIVMMDDGVGGYHVDEWWYDSNGDRGCWFGDHDDEPQTSV